MQKQFKRISFFACSGGQWLPSVFRKHRIDNANPVLELITLDVWKHRTLGNVSTGEKINKLTYK